jgi:hypothetical protein
LHQLLVWLNQDPPAELALEPVPAILEWASRRWDPAQLAGRACIAVERRAPEGLKH